MSDKTDNSTLMVKEELESKLAPFVSKEQSLMIQNAATSFLPVSIDRNGKQFWKDIILASTKDYPTEAMQYYQVVREGKTRVSRLLDEVVSHEELLLDIEELEYEIEQLSNKTEFNKKDEIELKRKEIKLKQKKVKVEFSKNSIQGTIKEVEDFKSLSEDYDKENLKVYEEARVEEMNKKIIDRYVHHILTGVPLSNPETGFYYKDGFIVPPQEAIDILRQVGRSDLADTEQMKLDVYNNWKNPQPKNLSTEDLFGIKVVSKEEVLGGSK